ncbi:MAG: hypothetical protein NVSMB44_30150 [Ktedonobacteraceae bacterium]
MPSTCLKRPFRVSITGPIGSGKTLLIAALLKRLSLRYNLAVAVVQSMATSLWFTADPAVDVHAVPKDVQFFQQLGAVSTDQVQGVASIEACTELATLPGLNLLLVEYSGNDLAAAFNPALIDMTIYVIDVGCGDAVILKGGTGVVRSDVLVLNKTDLVPTSALEQLVLSVRQQRGERPFALTAVQCEQGVDEVAAPLEAALKMSFAERARAGQEIVSPALVEEQLFWRYKMSRSAHVHFTGVPNAPKKKVVSAAPMSSAPMRYEEDGEVAWDQMWTDFCDLAAIGGPPHRGTLLEPVALADIQAQPEAYERVVAEIERGLQMITGLPIIRSPIPGWVGMLCASEAMAVWIQQAILAENVSVRRSELVIYLPAGPAFSTKVEIKNVITVAAKTHHYWQEHMLAVPQE